MLQRTHYHPKKSALYPQVKGAFYYSTPGVRVSG